MMERSYRIVKKNTFVYIKSMEEKRKNIKELEQKRQEEFRSVNLMLEDLGEALLSREEAGEGDAGEYTREYQRIQQGIADSEGLISTIKGDVLRLKQAEEALALNEKALFKVKQDLEQRYTGLGERLLEDGTYGEFTEPYRRQFDALEDKVKSLEDRMEALAARPPANPLVQLGRKTQSMLFRAALEKNHSEVRRIYEAAGEKFASREDGGPNPGGELDRVLEEIGKLRKQAGDLRAEEDRLRGERREIAGSLNIQGGPVKRAAALEKGITRLKNERRTVYGKYGEFAREKARNGEWEVVFNQDDRLLLQRIEETRNYIGDIENQIEKNQASLAIDEERGAIVKMEKAISDHRVRIAAAEKAIGDLEERIRKAEQRIEELKQIEAYGNKN
jgi:chromosome segregation ATPase